MDVEGVFGEKGFGVVRGGGVGYGGFGGDKGGEEVLYGGG